MVVWNAWQRATPGCIYGFAELAAMSDAATIQKIAMRASTRA
jgi:hypothetical protein